MSEEDVALYLEWELADSEEVANKVCGVQCLSCDDVVILEPGTREPVAERSCVERIESVDDVEPHEVRIYCSNECRDTDLLRTDGGVEYVGDLEKRTVRDCPYCGSEMATDTAIAHTIRVLSEGFCPVVTADDVAEELGVSTQTVYNHIEDVVTSNPDIHTKDVDRATVYYRGDGDA